MKDGQLKRALSIFATFLKFGCFTFGGGWSIVAQMQKEYVEKRGWLTDEELLDYTSVGRSTPGLMIGNPGALAAILGITIPPILIMLLVVYIYDLVKDNLYVSRAMIGVRAAVVPIIISALLKLLKSGLKDAFCYLVAAAALGLCLFTGMNNALIVLLGALAGLCWQEVQSRHDLS